MHAVRGFFRFAHIDGLIRSDPAVYTRLPTVQHNESRSQGVDRLELVRFLQVAQTITVHHGALASLLEVNALRASEAAAVRIEDYRETLRGHRVLHLVGKGNKPATMPITVPVLRVLEAANERPDRCYSVRTRATPSTVAMPTEWWAGSRRSQRSRDTSARTHCGMPRSPMLDAGVPLRDAQILARHADPRTTEHYDRARGNLDRHGVHFLTVYVAAV